VPLTLAPRERLDLLIARLQAPDGAAMHYDAWFTASASSAFHERRFNCLSFSHLVIALAREIGLDAYYLQALYRERYDREGDLVLLAGHVTAGWGDGVQRWVVDFGNAPALGNARVRQLDDRRALALHYANLGAAFLRRGDTRSAMSALATALEVDPGTAGAWVNWGVALRRNGDVAGAEAAYRAAIEVEPSLVPGYANLYGLLRATGRTREAAGLVTEIGKLPNHDPWLMLAMGDECIAARDLAGAERLYRQAHRAARDEAAPNAALAELALARGDEENARKWVRRAEELDAWEPRLYRLRAKLAMPQPPARTTSAGPPEPPPGAAAAPSPQPNRGSR
jgi:Flp pilus assembly protein TadD